MIQIVLGSRDKREIVLLVENFKEQTAMQTDESMRCYSFLTLEEVLQFLKKKELLDIICMDITWPCAIEACEHIRKICPSVHMVLIAVPELSPVTYMKPTIMASSLLLRPLEQEDVDRVSRELIRLIAAEETSPEEAMVVKTRDGRNRIPYDSIMYVESREKKICVCTEAREYCFYGTIEQMNEELPEGFIRCHRSYIVNQSFIEGFQLTKGILNLGNGIVIPVSRKYKNVLKEYMR